MATIVISRRQQLIAAFFVTLNWISTAWSQIGGSMPNVGRIIGNIH